MKDIQFNERKLHGLPEFPFQYYFIDTTHPQYVMPLHWHSEFEIIRVISGTFELYLDNRLINLEANDCAIINCTTMHRGAPKNCVYECMVFSLSMLYKKATILYANTYDLSPTETLELKNYQPKTHV